MNTFAPNKIYLQLWFSIMFTRVATSSSYLQNDGSTYYDQYNLLNEIEKNDFLWEELEASDDVNFYDNEEVVKRRPSNSYITSVNDKSTQISSTPRSDHRLPCSCRERHGLKRLGPGYFPRYIPMVICNKTACWGGPYRCQEILYGVKVLRQRGRNDVEGTEVVPETLKASWLSETVKVPVACECSP